MNGSWLLRKYYESNRREQSSICRAGTVAEWQYELRMGQTNNKEVLLVLSIANVNGI